MNFRFPVTSALRPTFSAMICMSFWGCGGSPDAPLDAAIDGNATDSGMPDGSKPPDGSVGDALILDLDPAHWIEPIRPELPEPPLWEPEFPVEGPTGWQSSTTPLCNDDTGRVVGDRIYADANAVYVSTNVYNNPLDWTNPWVGRPSGRAVHRNDGSGWVRRFWAPSELGGEPRLVATTTGDLFLAQFGYVDGVPCAIARIGSGPVSANTVSCTRVGGDVGALFIAGDAPYSLTMDAQHSAVGRAIQAFDGNEWTKVSDLPIGSAEFLWTDSATFVAAGGNSTVVVHANSTLQNYTEVAPAADYRSVWAFGPDNIWLGKPEGELVHFDGISWSTLSAGIEGCAQDSDVIALWGHGESVYFLTKRAFGRWNGAAMERFVDLGCDADTTFRDFWGKPDGSEIYLTIEDATFANYKCGSIFAIWFDGSDFHRF